jgi:hypothetical protein
MDQLRHNIQIQKAEHGLPSTQIFCPASDLERYAANPRPTNSEKDAFKISPMQPSLCGLDRLLYNYRMDKLGRSS